ncbi:MAG: efflux RND transporter permease subunit [Pseudomonadota bacterium]|nr:efflux RND transporter permease subunit [Pseudomonadota bacterium]
MSGGFSALFVGRPVATILLTIGIALAGLLAFPQLPVSPLPQIDFATIVVQANMPGASPDNMATNVAAPLERHLGQIADVTEMTSQSSLGNTRVILQFGLDRDIDGAARDVQAAINAARADLPASLKLNPSYHKINPADAPIMVLALTSTTRPKGQLYDLASNLLQQRLSQLAGIGEVDVTGSALPAVRVELNPNALYHYGVGLEDVRAALASANANSPKGQIEDADFNYQIYANDQASKAAHFRDLVIAYRDNAAVRLSDVAEVVDSVEDLRNAGLANGKPAIGIVLSREPGANIIQAVDNVKALLPRLIAALPGDVELTVVVDRSITIRGSLDDTIKTLITSVVLVILVVFVFLRDVRASAVPSVAVPVSIIGSFAAMYFLGFSLNNLSLMALTISTGFVVDDAIVVLENVTRHLEQGKSRMQAAILGASEVSFTVVSISLSLVAVFLPLLLMGGLVGRLFKEFTVTLSMAVLISMVVSLTTTPVMCALLLPREARKTHGRFYRWSEAGFDVVHDFYRVTLDVVLGHPWKTFAVFAASFGLMVWLFAKASYSLFPVQDTGLMIGSIQGDQSISFQAMSRKLAQLQEIVQDDPAVATVVGVTGGRQVNSGFVYISLKPFKQRKITADGVVSRLRGKLAQVAGARLFLVAVSDLRVGGRQSNATYQYTLLSDDTAELYKWAPRLTAELAKSDVLKDVNSDQQQGGLEADVEIDRATLSRVGLNLAAVDNTLYDAYGQRQVSTIYNALNQYHVVMEVAPRYWQHPEALRGVYVSTSGVSPRGTQTTNANAASFSTPTSAASSATAATIAADSARNLATNALAASGRSAASAGAAVTTSKETMVPLAAFAGFKEGHTPLGVNHQGQFAAATLSFNLAQGKALSDAETEVAAAERAISMPAAIRGSFSGTALASKQAQGGQILLLGAALLTVYLVLGILYESYIHPITIISTLPSAALGALIALRLFDTEVTIIAFIGIILLIGIVKKNAIMLIDFALAAEREGLDTREAIRQACLMRFRPILMTTMAALFGALPLALGTGEGSELRQPLGITIVGGLIVSQVLTLYTTPVLFLFLDRLGKAAGRGWRWLYLGERRPAGA